MAIGVLFASSRDQARGAGMAAGFLFARSRDQTLRGAGMAAKLLFASSRDQALRGAGMAASFLGDRGCTRWKHLISLGDFSFRQKQG